MTIKSFGFLNPVSEENTQKNWRTLDTNTKFGLWEPVVTDIANVGSTEGYYQLYGPIVFYWIKLTYNGTQMTTTGGPKISNLPYGPESVSGKKTTAPYQVSLTARAGAANASQSLAAGYDPWVSAVSGTSYIYLPGTWSAANTQNIWIQGWIFRDA